MTETENDQHDSNLDELNESDMGVIKEALMDQVVHADTEEEFYKFRDVHDKLFGVERESDE